MLALRLGRGSPPLMVLRRALVALSAAGCGFLLLSALGHAVAHPEDPGAALVRLLWCLLPLAAAVQLAVAVARTDPAVRARPGLDTAGAGAARQRLLGAALTAVTALLGTVCALPVFLFLRGDLLLPAGVAARLSDAGLFGAELLGAGRPLPAGAVLLLLAVPPALAASAVALPWEPVPGVPGRRPGTAPLPVPGPAGLPWGAAIVAAGLAAEAYAGRGAADGRAVPLPGAPGGSAATALAGWLLIVLGAVLAGPGLTHLCGRLLAAGRPGALRLLSGRTLQQEAWSIGRPLGVLCAASAGTLSAAVLAGAAPDGWSRLFGPLPLLGMGIALGCAAASVCVMAAAAGAGRAESALALSLLGASRPLRYSAAALRAAVLLTALAPATWLLSRLAALMVLP